MGRHWCDRAWQVFLKTGLVPREALPRRGAAARDAVRCAELARQLDVAAGTVQNLARREALLRATLALRGTHRQLPACPAAVGGGCACGLDQALAQVDVRVAARPWANAHGLVLAALARDMPLLADPEAAAAARAAERLTRLLAELETAVGQAS
jgi:hypothetical protein